MSNQAVEHQKRQYSRQLAAHTFRQWNAVRKDKNQPLGPKVMRKEEDTIDHPTQAASPFGWMTPEGWTHVRTPDDEKENSTNKPSGWMVSFWDLVVR